MSQAFLLRAIRALGFVSPTPIQVKAIPIALAGRDICGSAMTGSGKTAAFLLPLMERLQYRNRNTPATRVLIIMPTRELAAQCQAMLTKLAQFTDITSALVVGGLSIAIQAVELRKRPDVVICTPGRMIDHLRNSQSVDLDDVEVLVLDEADRLLEFGFEDEVIEQEKRGGLCMCVCVCVCVFVWEVWGGGVRVSVVMSVQLPQTTKVSVSFSSSFFLCSSSFFLRSRSS